MNTFKISTYRNGILVAFMALTLLGGLSACKGTQKDKETKTCIDESKIDPDGRCMKNYQPVCGCDGVTYDNPCFAEKAGVTEWTAGKCK